MRGAEKRFDLVHESVIRVFADDLHAKRILSLANGTLGVMTGAALAVSLIGHALAQARGLVSKSAIKQVDRLLINAGAVPWDLFGSGFARSWASGAISSWRWTGPTSMPTISPRSPCISSPVTEGPPRSSG